MRSRPLPPPDASLEDREAALAEGRARLRGRAFTVEVPPAGLLGACGECGGSGWVEMDDGTETMPYVRPCASCSSPAFDRWAGGHHEPGHERSHCDDPGCAERRRQPRRRKKPE